jgi:hypothetical protein
MKKIYLSPMIEISDNETMDLLMSSGVFDPDRGIGYGGADEEGNMEPASRLTVWDDEEDY